MQQAPSSPLFTNSPHQRISSATNQSQSMSCSSISSTGHLDLPTPVPKHKNRRNPATKYKRSSSSQSSNERASSSSRSNNSPNSPNSSTNSPKRFSSRSTVGSGSGSGCGSASGSTSGYASGSVSSFGRSSTSISSLSSQQKPRHRLRQTMVFDEVEENSPRQPQLSEESRQLVAAIHQACTPAQTPNNASQITKHLHFLSRGGGWTGDGRGTAFLRQMHDRLRFMEESLPAFSLNQLWGVALDCQIVVCHQTNAEWWTCEYVLKIILEVAKRQAVPEPNFLVDDLVDEFSHEARFGPKQQAQQLGLVPPPPPPPMASNDHQIPEAVVITRAWDENDHSSDAMDQQLWLTFKMLDLHDTNQVTVDALKIVLESVLNTEPSYYAELFLVALLQNLEVFAPQPSTNPAPQLRRRQSAELETVNFLQFKQQVEIAAQSVRHQVEHSACVGDPQMELRATLGVVVARATVLTPQLNEKSPSPNSRSNMSTKNVGFVQRVLGLLMFDSRHNKTAQNKEKRPSATPVVLVRGNSLFAGTSSNECYSLN